MLHNRGSCLFLAVFRESIFGVSLNLPLGPPSYRVRWNNKCVYREFAYLKEKQQRKIGIQHRTTNVNKDGNIMCDRVHESPVAQGLSRQWYVVAGRLIVLASTNDLLVDRVTFLLRVALWGVLRSVTKMLAFLTWVFSTYF